MSGVNCNQAVLPLAVIIGMGGSPMVYCANFLHNLVSGVNCNQAVLPIAVIIRMRKGSPMVYCDKIVGKSYVSNELHWCIQHIIFVGVLDTGLFHITPHAYDHSLPKSSANPLSLFIFINSQDIGVWITNK